MARWYNILAHEVAAVLLAQQGRAEYLGVPELTRLFLAYHGHWPAPTDPREATHYEAVRHVLRRRWEAREP